MSDTKAFAERWRKTIEGVEESNHGGMRRVWYENGMKFTSEARYPLIKEERFPKGACAYGHIEDGIYQGDCGKKASGHNLINWSYCPHCGRSIKVKSAPFDRDQK